MLDITLRSLATWVRGLLLLRHSEVVRALGEMRGHRQCVAHIRALAKRVRIDDRVVLVGYAPGRITLGDGAHIREGTILAFGEDSVGTGELHVGADTWIGQYNNLRASGGVIRIGSRCLVSQFCTLVATQHAFDVGRPIGTQGHDPTRVGITIGDDVWLGAGVVVTPGVVIGSGAVIGANAVVTASIPENEVWAGVPARRLSERRPEGAR